MEIKPLYTLSEVAAMLGRSVKTIKRWRRKGLLVTVDFGGRPMVAIATLKAQAAVWDSLLLAAKLNQR